MKLLKQLKIPPSRIADSNLGQTAITIVVWKLLYKEIAGVVIGIIFIRNILVYATNW